LCHSQGAKGLVEIGGERINEFAGRVGEHHERAEDWINVAEWYERAGRQALVLTEEDQTPEYIGMAWRTLGKICDRTDDVVRFSDWETYQINDYDAKTCFSKSAAILVESEIELEHAHTLREWAHYKFKTGDSEQGE
jgi:hypothetical protein